MTAERTEFVGLYITENGVSVEVTANLTFHEDMRVDGQFTIKGNKHWHGPQTGYVRNGHYQADGTIHFEENENSGQYGAAKFDGRYEEFSGQIRFIYGLVTVSKDTATETGVLTLGAPRGHVRNAIWGE